MNANELDDIFKINKDIKVTEVTKDYIIIDNVYADVNKVLGFVKSLNGELNGITKDQELNKYSQTRKRISSLPLNDEYVKLTNFILEQITKHFNVTVKIKDHEYIFNTVINMLENKDQKLQHWPHTDRGPITNLIYLDEIAKAGTKFYKDPDITPENKEAILKTLERGNGYYRDISILEETGYCVPKQNRMVILNGSLLHGAFYEDHNAYLNKERVTQLVFTSN